MTKQLILFMKILNRFNIAELAVTGAIEIVPEKNFIKNQDFNSFSNDGFELIATARQVHMTRNKNNLPLLHVKHNFYKNSFFPSAIIEWNHVDSNIRNSETNYKAKARFKSSSIS